MLNGELISRFKSIKINITDGTGATLCPDDNTVYLLIAQDIGDYNAYILASGIRRSSVYPDGAVRWSIISNNILGFGDSNEFGTQNISGAAPKNIKCICFYSEMFL